MKGNTSAVSRRWLDSQSRSSISLGIKLLLATYLLISVLHTSAHVLHPVTRQLSTIISASYRQARWTISTKGQRLQLEQDEMKEKLLRKYDGLEAASVRAVDIRQDALHERVWSPASDDDLDEEISAHRDGRELVDRRRRGPEGVEWAVAVDTMDWRRSESSTSDEIDGSSGSTEATTSTPQDDFLSLAFSSSLHPSKVIPYYYKASAPDDVGFVHEDITIITLVTSNRFAVFSKLVDRYRGPISATVHVSDGADHDSVLKSLDDMYTSSPSMMQFVDIHLVYDSFDRQFNMWRNIAKYYARTDYVLMLDVDFWLCTEVRSTILQSTSIMHLLKTGSAAFVIPAFEFVEQPDGIDPSTFPSTKDELSKLVLANKIEMFHYSFKAGHAATDYDRFFSQSPEDLSFYRVTQYNHGYEPYVVYKREGSPSCDERFIGYGANKAACLFELYLSGVSFYVLPFDFIIHQSHAYAEKVRTQERKYNRELYTNFREELCFRYFNQMLDGIGVDSPRAANLRRECRKIKGFEAASSRLIAGSGAD